MPPTHCRRSGGLGIASQLPNLPAFPSPPEFPETRPPAVILADFLYELFDSGVASVVDPLPLAINQHWRDWARQALQPVAPNKPEAAAPAQPAAPQRPSLKALLEQGHRRLLLELPNLPGDGPGPGTGAGAVTPMPQLDLTVAVEAARRLYQVCQVLAAPQQDKNELRRSFPTDFRPLNLAGLLSAHASWRFLPMAWEHVRQRLTIATGATVAMQEVERLIREQLTAWPLPMDAVLAQDLTPDGAALAILDEHPLGRRYLAEQLLSRAMVAPSPRLAGWTTPGSLTLMRELLGGLALETAREPLVRSFGHAGEELIQGWQAWLEHAAAPAESADLPPLTE